MLTEFSLATVTDGIETLPFVFVRALRSMMFSQYSGLRSRPRDSVCWLVLGMRHYSLVLFSTPKSSRRPIESPREPKTDAFPTNSLASFALASNQFDCQFFPLAPRVSVIRRTVETADKLTAAGYSVHQPIASFRGRCCRYGERQLS